MIRRLINKFRFIKQKYKFRQAIKKKLETSNLLDYALEDDFVKSVEKYWRNGFGIEPDINTFKYLVGVTGVPDVRYISEDVYVNYILPKTNPYNRCNGLNDKNVFPLLFPNLTPCCLFCDVNGILMDSNYNIISENKITDLLKNEDKVVIKPTTNTCQGKNVVCVEKYDVQKYMKLLKKDYTVQKLIRQHKVLAGLNSSSVNVIRITTYLSRDGVKILDAIIRVGSAGNFTDHLNLAVGIESDGRLKDFGVTVSGKRVYEFSNGKKIKDIVIPSFEKMCEVAAEMHCRLAQALIIGWDFTVDENGKPVIIEANLDFPGILRSQECNGPLFGEYTEEILKSCQ